MKLRQILATGALALAVAASAQAASTTYIVRIAGSSAYRQAIHQGVIDLLGGSSNTSIKYGYTDGALSKANAAIITGTTQSAISTDNGTIPAGSTIIVCTSWTGSVAGIYSLANTATTSRGFISATTNSLSSTGTAATISDMTSTVDVAMSDVFLATAASVVNTDWSDATITEAGLSSGYTGVGICPFKWIVSGTTSGINNITAQNIQALYNAGTIDKSLLVSGTTASGTVYAFGRDTDSGTRLTAFAESGLGATFLPVQYGVVSGSTLVANSGTLTFSPASIVNGESYAKGQGGYSSGGTLVSAIAYSGTSLGKTAITYASVSDASSVVSGAAIGAKELTYNGVPYSVANVCNGAYTFWSYEHMFYRASDASIGAGIFAEALAAQVRDNTVVTLSGSATSASTSGSAPYIPVTIMNVSRGDDGGIVSQ